MGFNPRSCTVSFRGIKNKLPKADQMWFVDDIIVVGSKICQLIFRYLSSYFYLCHSHDKTSLRSCDQLLCCLESKTSFYIQQPVPHNVQVQKISIHTPRVFISISEGVGWGSLLIANMLKCT